MASDTMRTSAARVNRVIRSSYPEQGHWSEEDYLLLTDRCPSFVEFTDGYLEVLSMPTDKHQAICDFLYFALRVFLRPLGGIVRFPVLRLRIRAGKFREPDLLALRNAKDPRRQNRFWTGADLVAEVVSPDDPRRDLVEKRKDYAEGKVAEYWVVNPLDETILVYALHGKKYRRVGSYGRGKTASSVLLKGFAVKVADVLDAA